jgi:TolB-like protein/Tfp pilus assembly protein PilF
VEEPIKRDPLTFLAELKRRRVVRVLLLYLATAFAVVEASDIVLAALSQPDWMLQAVLALVALGLPVALVLAWMFDIDVEQGGVDVARAEAAEPGQISAEPRRGLQAPATRWVSPASLIAAAALIIFGVAAGSILGPLIGGGGGVEAGSIAVLPLQNLSPDPDNQYFADGIHEDILTHLAKIDDFKVISRTSVLEYRDVERNIPEIAAELGVASVLEGSVRRDQDRVRITAQLIDAATDQHIWAETYDRTLEDVFAIQEEIARHIAESLEAVLSPQEESSLSEKPTENLEAYEEYLRGSETLTRAEQGVDPRLLVQSVEALEAAVRLDPSFDIAWAHLAVALEWSQRLTTDAEEQTELQGRAAAAAERAFGLDPDSPEALFAVAFQGSRAPEASLRVEEDISRLEQALAAMPSGAEILRELGHRYELLGEIDQAARYADEAVELDPRSALFQIRGAIYSRLLGDLDKAELHVQLADSLSSDSPLARTLLVRERLLLELARGGGVARMGEIFRVEEPQLTRVDMLAILGEFPELMTNGEYEDLVLALSPSADDPDLRCACYRIKAWGHEIAGRSDAARIYWDSLSADVGRRPLRPWELPNSDRDRFREATVLARAGRTQAAAALLEEGVTPSAGDRHDTHYERAAAYAALGDVEAAVQELRHLLSVPSEVTTASLRDRLVWEPIRDDPSFQALLEG